jgi:two-component system, response regulator YesN
MRIIVVEDEQKPREGLVRLISKLDPGYEVVGQARNGLEGKEMTLSLSPDLVFTDIKMPVMDGLEMIEALRASGSTAHFVILSGYAQFEYAKRGIVLGVKDYLLKPITPAILDSVLRKIAAERAESPRGKASDLRFPPGALFHFYSTRENPEVESLLFSMFEKVVAATGSGGFRLVDRPDPSSLLFHLASALPFGELAAAFDSAIHAEGGRFRRAGLVCAAAAMTDADMKGLSLELRSKLKWSMLVEKPRVIHDGLIRELAPPLPVYPARVEGAALDAIRNGKPENLEAAVEDFLLFCVSGRYSPPALSEAAYRFFFTAMNLMKEVDYLGFRSIVDLDILDRVKDFRSSDELTGIFADFLGCVKKSPTACSDTFSFPVRQTVNYIRSCYRDKLSLEEAAEKIGFTPEYLSSLFQKETGKNFSTYVAEFRIEKAKKLLARGNVKAYEVALDVGIGDPQYFCRVFKKHTGLSPGDYSRLHS